MPPRGNHGVIGPGRPLYGQAPTFQGDRSAMSRISRDQIRKLLDEAEGYLMLDLPRRSLQILGSRPDWSTMQFEANFLKGEALRCLDRYREALKPLEMAASLRPGDTRVALALGWCYKRTNRLAQAIDSLERALREHPYEPLLHYNLACYWSLAGNGAKAVERPVNRAGDRPRTPLPHRRGAGFRPSPGNPEFDRFWAAPTPDRSAAPVDSIGAQATVDLRAAMPGTGPSAGLR